MLALGKEDTGDGHIYNLSETSLHWNADNKTEKREGQLARPGRPTRSYDLNTVWFLTVKQEETQQHLGREMFVVPLWAFMTTTHKADVEDEDAESWRVCFIKPISASWIPHFKVE